VRTSAKHGVLNNSEAPQEERDAHADRREPRQEDAKANELVLCMGVNQLRTPNIAMIAAACGFDAVYIDPEHNPTSLENRGRGVRRGIGHRHHADCPGHLA
jgi:hypothetical protein